MWNYIWPILIVVAANTFYNICAKSTPDNVQPFAMLIVTYLTAAAMSAVLFFVTSENKNFIVEMKKMNWTSYIFGFAIIALEFGYIQIYRVGWNVSVGSLIANIGLACILVVVGFFLYNETINANQIIGIILCIVGIVFISK